MDGWGLLVAANGVGWGLASLPFSVFIFVKGGLGMDGLDNIFLYCVQECLCELCAGHIAEHSLQSIEKSFNIYAGYTICPETSPQFYYTDLL